MQWCDEKSCQWLHCIANCAAANCTHHVSSTDFQFMSVMYTTRLYGMCCNTCRVECCGCQPGICLLQFFYLYNLLVVLSAFSCSLCVSVACYCNDIIIDLSRQSSVRLDLFISCGHSMRHVCPHDLSSAEVIEGCRCSLYTECSLKWNFVTRRLCDNYLCSLFSICNLSFIVIYYVIKKYWDLRIQDIFVCFVTHSVRCCNNIHIPSVHRLVVEAWTGSAKERTLLQRRRPMTSF